jgi:3-dehydroquinate dehydratase-2
MNNMTSLLILNGPNLNLLGTREPEIYGAVTLEEIEATCVAYGETKSVSITFLQSNHEGVLVDNIHAATGTHAGIILNAGAFTHTSIALHDAIVGTQIPTIELHLSNIHKREEFRHHSYIARAAVGVICGFGAAGYNLAINAMVGQLESNN